MFGAYSFINIPDGREETGEDGHSFKNNAEVAAVFTILRKLHKGMSKDSQYFDYTRETFISFFAFKYIRFQFPCSNF